MVLARQVNEQVIARSGVFELRKRGKYYVLVREGYALLLLNRRELHELKQLLNEVVDR